MKTTKPAKALIEQEAKKEIADYLKNIRYNIRKKLEAATTSLLGLEHRYGDRYEIDHCNGRNSVFIDVLRDMAKDEAIKLTKHIKLPKADSELIQQAFVKELKDQLRYEMRNLATTKAKAMAQELINNVLPEDIKELLDEPVKSE
jgi:hypothetical protein